MNFPRAVDNTDWLKTAAIILVCVDHFGYFLIDNDQWWSVFGRLAAPPFFFLMGYAKTRTVPLKWIWIGVILTLLESWNADWSWVVPNILLNLALIRIARPYVQNLAQHNSWAFFGLLISAFSGAVPIAAKIVDYGAEGWLWALFGLYQRMVVDNRSVPDIVDSAPDRAVPTRAMKRNADLMRLLACLVAAAIYVWQEQREYAFTQVHFTAFIIGIGILSLSLCLFLRGPSRIQPPEPIAGALRFIGHRTLEIYAIQLAGFELIIKLVPGLAP
jgi:hypothetical protein